MLRLPVTELSPVTPIPPEFIVTAVLLIRAFTRAVPAVLNAAPYNPPLNVPLTPDTVPLLVILAANNVPVLFNVAVVMLVLTTMLACCASPLVFIVAPNTLALL